MWVADGSAVVGHNVRNFVFSKLLLRDFAKLEAGFSGVNSDWLETTLDVVEHAEVLVGLWDSEHVHKSEWVPWISSGSVVNFEIASSNSAHLERLLAGESVLESVAEQHRQRDALSQLVGSRCWVSSLAANKLAQAPLLGGEHALQMLPWSSCLTQTVT